MTEFLLNMGFTLEQIPQLMEVLGLFILTIGIIFFILIPLMHRTFLMLDAMEAPQSTGNAPDLPTVSEYLRILRTTLKQWLKWGLIGGAGLTAFSFILSSPSCTAHRDTCFVWAEAIVWASMFLIGIVMIANFARRLYRQGWNNNIFYILLNLMLICGLGSFTIHAGWNTLFGGNCSQSARQPRSDLSLALKISDPPFPIGTEVRLQRDTLTLEPWETDYCIPVMATVGARATVQAYVPRRDGSGYTMEVLWPEQSFQELSWIGLVLERHVQLQPFTSALSPDDIAR